MLAGVELSAGVYYALLACQAAALCLYLSRRAPRASALVLGGLFALDTQVGFENHRMLLAIQLLLVGLVAVPRGEERTAGVFWSMELLGWLVSIVYASTALDRIFPPRTCSSSRKRGALKDFGRT